MKGIMKRTKNTYFYIVTISGLYFLMVILLHSRLQVEICQTRTEYKKAEIHAHSVSNENISSVPVIFKSPLLVNVKSQFVFDKSVPCHLPADSRNFTFQTIADNFFFVYTAYLDTRMNITFVRIMSILLKGKADNVIVVCNFRSYGAEDFFVHAKKYEMCENHNKKYGGWIMSCPLLEKIAEPCQVKVSIIHKTDPLFRSNNVTLNLIKLSPSSANHNYGVCVPPLFGSVNHSRLIEFMEFTQYFGAKKFIFYDHEIKDVKSLIALEYYTNKTIATIIPWKLPNDILDTEIWYHGQLIAHNDCLYRSMSLVDKLAIQDIDELIVPHDGSIFWDQSLTPLFKSSVVGLGIHSAFFDTAFSGVVLAISSIRRTKVFSRLRTKVLVKPSAIFEVGIHHVSKPLFEEYKIISPSTEIVVLHHYRRCLSNYGMNCKDWVLDETIKNKYGHIEHNIVEVNAVITKLELSTSIPDDNAQVVAVSQNKIFL